MELVASHYSYIFAALLFCLGLFMVITSGNLAKKLFGLSLFQSAVLLLFISIGKVSGAAAPILENGQELYTNPLPQVLMLTAIVVGLATLAVAISLVIRIKKEFGSIEEDNLNG